MRPDIIAILIVIAYVAIHLVFVGLAKIHDRKIWKEEHKVSTLSMDTAMFMIFWPITAWFLIPKYLRNKEYYKYGVPYDDLF